MRIEVENAVARFPEYRFREPLDWVMDHGENWAVVGPNGSGKTMFADIVQGSIVLKEGSVRCLSPGGEELHGRVKSLVFRDIHSLSVTSGMYYQQRWNSQDAEESPFVSSLVKDVPRSRLEHYSSLFGIGELLEKRLISLSSGELRKFLITRALMSEPSAIILDNPFIGLDAASRKSLDNMLSGLSRNAGMQTILVLSQLKDLPVWVDKVLPVCGMKCLPPVTREAFLADSNLQDMLFPDSRLSCPALPEPSGGAVEPTYSTVLEMKDVLVKYAGIPILEGVDWKVKKGENWALLGENGCGKSTLLSLVCGDNPQAYSNNISLFDRRRGTGESIWDIKRRIGYLSPDIHSYYLEDIPVIKVVASGFFDSVGLSRECTGEQYGKAVEWMRVFGAEHLADRSFLKISYGEQRLALLVRAFVKNPELLILDEPLHGLDAGKKALAKSVIEKYCSRPDRTLIYVSHYEDEIPGCVTFRKVLSKKKQSPLSQGDGN